MESATAPDVGRMIALTLDSPAQSGDTALDDLHLELQSADGDGEPDAAPDVHVSDTPKRSYTRRAGPAPKKADLAKRVAQLEAENAALAKAANEKKVASNAMSLQLIAIAAFGVCAEFRGPHWALEESEAKAFGDAAAVAGAEYWEELEKQLPWIAPVIILGTAVGKRVVIDIKKARGTYINTGPLVPAGVLR